MQSGMRAATIEYFAVFSHGKPVTRIRVSAWALPLISKDARWSEQATRKGNKSRASNRVSDTANLPKQSANNHQATNFQSSDSPASSGTSLSPPA